MKVLKKHTIILRRSVSSVMKEMRFLSHLNHPFLINAHYAFQDKTSLYLVLDYVNGGDLRYHIIKQQTFPQKQVRFFVCCILLGLQYLHSNRILHRDLKPQNLVFDNKGYLRITDLGVSSKLFPKNGEDTSGTPGYMSPEVIAHCDHQYPCDFFSVGVIVYQLMTGRRPYMGRSRQEVRQQMLARQAKIEAPPVGWSVEAADFVNRLLERKPALRLGSKQGCDELRNHPWIRDFEWKALESFRLRAPFIPRVKIKLTKPLQEQQGAYCQANISSDGSTENQQNQQIALLLKNITVQEMFSGYEFNANGTTRQRHHRTVSQTRRVLHSKEKKG